MKHNSDAARQKVLESYLILDTLPEKEYDEIAHLAASITNMPISLISLLDTTRQFFKSHVGVAITETPIDISFCKYAIKHSHEIFIVNDTRKDDRFKDNPLVTSETNIGFYAGVQLITKDNIALGTLCVLDTKPNQLSDQQIKALQTLANQVMHLLELRKAKAKAEKHEKELQKEAIRLEQILEGTQAGSWEWFVQSGALDINERWAGIAGYTVQELAPVTIDTWYTLLHPDDKVMVDQHLNECFERRCNFYDIECRLIHKMGHTVWVGARGRITEWSEDNKPLLMSGTHIDITEKKNIEIRFKNTINNVPGVIFRFIQHPGRKKVIEQVSQKSDEIWGISAEEINKNSQVIWERVDASDLPSLLTSIEESASNLSHWHCAWRYHHPDGSIKWLEGTGNPSKNGDGSIIWDSLVIDITAAKISELEASRLADEMNKIMERSLDMICTIDEQSRFSKVSKAAERILGYAPEELEGRSFIDYIYPDDVEKTIKAAEVIRSGKSTTNFENRYIKKDGSIIPLIWSASYDEKDQMTFCIGKDATEKKLAEANLLLSEQRFKALVQEGSDLIIIVDIDGNYCYSSSSSKEILGYMPTEFRGKNVSEFLHPSDREEFFANFSQIKYKKKVAFKPFRYKHKNGSYRYVETVLTNMLDDPAVGGLVSNSRDVTERILAEEKLKQSEEKYYKLFAIDPLPKFIYELETYRIIDVNESAVHHYGFSRIEFLEKKFIDILKAKDIEKFKTLHLNVKEQSDNINFGIFNQQKKDRKTIDTDIFGHRIKLLDKDCMMVVCIDVTERERAFRSLQFSEARYKGLYESQTNYVIRTDMLGNYSYVNKKFVNNFGWLYPDGKILGKQSLSSIMDYDHDKLYEVVEKCVISPGTVFKIELDKPTVDGGYVSTLWDFICITDDKANPSEIQCVGIDITDRKKFERELIKSNERYEKVTKATNDSIWDWDLVTKQVFRTGEGFTNLFGYSKEEAGKDTFFWRNKVDPDQLEEVINSQVDVLKDPSKSYWEYEYRFQKKDGSYAYVYDRGFVVRDEDGRPLRMIGATQDITYRKDYEASLERLNQELAKHSKELEISNAELEQFAYVASHDLQEPLRMVTSFLSQLDRKYSDKLDDKAKQYIHFAVDGAKRMRQIILDLLEFSRLSQAQEFKETIELDLLFDDYKILRQRLIHEKSAKIIIDPMPIIYNFKVPITQIFHNLLDNALKYSKKDTPPIIKISAEEQEDQWLFSVEDNGIGIEKEYFDKIFIIFQRLHGKEEYSGTGMGLAIVKKIIENLRGEIWLESIEGLGTKFYFTIKKQNF